MDSVDEFVVDSKEVQIEINFELSKSETNLMRAFDGQSPGSVSLSSTLPGPVSSVGTPAVLVAETPTASATVQLADNEFAKVKSQ